jgi:hypothetical protein
VFAKGLLPDIGQAGFIQTEVACCASVYHVQLGQPDLVNAWFKAATETDGVTSVTNQSEVAALEEMPLAEVLFGGRDGEGQE